jgi:hypothetical protein
MAIAITDKRLRVSTGMTLSCPFLPAAAQYERELRLQKSLMQVILESHSENILPAKERLLGLSS